MGEQKSHMDYKEAACELFAMLLLILEKHENIEGFFSLCDRFPELFDELERQDENPDDQPSYCDLNEKWKWDVWRC